MTLTKRAKPLALISKPPKKLIGRNGDLGEPIKTKKMIGDFAEIRLFIK